MSECTQKGMDRKAWAIVVFLGTFVVTTFLYFWVSIWSTPPGSYPSAGAWWREFAIGRLGVGALVGLVVGLAGGGATYAIASNRQGRR